MAKRNLASVKITGTAKVRDNLLKFVQQQTRDEGVLNELGEFAADQIRKRVRGKVDKEYQQDPLTPATIGIRKNLIKNGNSKTPQTSKPSQSNLTLSGQLLDAIKHRVNASLATINIFLLKPRTGYILKDGSRTKVDKDNVEIKSDLEERGRLFLFISKSLNAQLQSKIAQALRKRLSLYRKISSK